jgi:hypothetical protein
MICDDEPQELGGGGGDPSGNDIGAQTPGASESKAVAFKFTNAGKMAARAKAGSSSGGSGGSGRAKDSGYWPDPIELAKAAIANPPTHNTKVAFLFLTRGPMPLEPLWAQFFFPEPKSSGANQGHRLASVYVHPAPEFDCSKHFQPPSPFAHRCLPRRLVVRTAWGSPSLVQAARNLLSYALHDDPLNAYFALLSDSCVPLFPLRFAKLHGWRRRV